MKKIVGIGICILIITGLLFLNPVDYFQKLKYEKVLSSLVTKDHIEIGEPLGIENAEVEEINHLGKNIFEIILLEGDSIIAVVGKNKSGRNWDFYKHELNVISPH